MKLKQLTIDNIASIEHAVINFDAAPLADEHLFLISGETGSGKSTIIDCICLALYGTTPRLDAAKKYDYPTAVKQEGANNDDLKTDDARQLMRRGTVSADVRLTFDDEVGTPYVATWHVHRSRHKIDGAIQKPTRIIETDEGVTKHLQYTKQEEFKKFAKEVIGLEMNEFFRTVVLAQGKFSEFLNSNEDDKAKLLERLTGTEIYKQIGSLIFEMCRAKETERDSLLEQLHGIVLLDEDEKAKINKELSEYVQAQTDIIKQGENAKLMIKWLDDKGRNDQELTLKKQDLAEKQAKTRENAYLERRQLVNDWDATIEPRRELRENERAERQIQLLQEEKPVMQQEFDRLCAALRATCKKLAEQQTRLDETGKFLQQEASNREMYKSIKGIQSLLKQRKTEQDNITEFTKALQQEEDRKPKAEANVQTSLDAVRQQDGLIKQLEAEYGKMDVAGINNQKDDLNNAKQAVSQLIADNDAITLAKSRLDNFKKEQVAEQQTREKLQASLPDKRTIKGQAQAAVERETDWNNLLQQAHKSLRQGDICPVCGNRIERLNAPNGENVLEELRERLRQAENDLNITETNIAASDKALKRIQGQVTDAEKEVIRLTDFRNKRWKLTCGLLAQSGITVENLIDNNEANALIVSLDKASIDLNNRLQEATALNNRITTERNKLTQLTESHNTAKIDLNKVIESIKHQNEAIRHNTGNVMALTRELDNMFTMHDWQERMQNDAGFVLDLEQKAEKYQRMEETAQQLKHEIGIAQTVIPAMEDNKRNIVGLEDNGIDNDIIPENLDEQWRLFENRNINWNNQLDNEQGKAKSARLALDRYIDDNPDMSVERLKLIDSHQSIEIDEIRKSQQELADHITHMLGEISALTKRQEEIAATKPDFPEEDREKLNVIYLSCQDKQKEVNTLIAELKARLKTDEANQKAVGEKKEALEKAESVFKQWFELKEMLGDAQGNKFRRIAQSYILNELLITANGYLRQFNGRYELEANPGTLVIMVRDLLQGDLTSVNTLSGGECFMVSLALALALSSTTGKMFTVDTLFIDEGFGSLSENYLDNVMDTLNRLYDMGGRRVGIISHVEMLKERVSTQIQVERDPGNNTVSRVRVV